MYNMPNTYKELFEKIFKREEKREDEPKDCVISNCKNMINEAFDKIRDPYICSVCRRGIYVSSNIGNVCTNCGHKMPIRKDELVQKVFDGFNKVNGN